MSPVLSAASLISLSPVNQFKFQKLRCREHASSVPSFLVVQCKLSRIFSQNTCKMFGHKSGGSWKLTARDSTSSGNQFLSEEYATSLDGENQEQVPADNLDSPWEGAIIYKRNASISHVEYCTTLERLGLGELSTEVSKSRASIMGLRVTNAVKDYPLGTPVMVSVDVTRKRQKLRLDGIIRTVLSLDCNRCGGPAAESIFSNFSLLLTEEPVEESDIIDMGVIYGDDKFKSSSGDTAEEDEDDESIDLDDRLHFPPDEKEIDISKNIRDTVHIEITINAICDPSCKGLCLKCGTNLNTAQCGCGKEEVVKGKGHGPVGDLRKQMQPK
ncbi:hypothetical protein HS088_TW03G00218 [Tripterygium wilfordii]|uniref:Uncharacterized protein n=1 Tax=Tripterygium wilfordii TaxID=458696 RepID=A0A7J7DUC2_TRIWF|nr:large ribosomal RNA subunit accumulation protein YCED homolog 1, chloroplastic [Tripterygium wilfordii]XP_038688694.1 large ribosomal RNA subunit accumulation protein YCED homolog 1, chloroplastic [Tripterygium wilfordii]XP_038688700.1 large ribosomal RNA subunit accumulation protein YCED homolog 1, chloroplastic [Tripterygium wilfordii]KAF5749891.1 hypothetical protein HS088_TW03G00218 [Tripterygium wilfordii]